jgi:hypothetical protein
MSRLQVSSLYSWCVFLMVICLFSPVFANAQSAQYATIVGQVVDPQDKVVPNATVTATNPATGFSRTTKTTSSGTFTIANLPPGTYNVKVDAGGSFNPGEAKDFKLNIGDQRDLNFKLSIAGSKQTYEVTSQAPLIQTTKTDVSTSLTDLDLQRLPAFAAGTGGANDYAGLALTAPGVKLDTSGISSPTGSASTGDLVGPGSVSWRANLYNVDGANITDQVVSGRDGLGASVDEIQELQVLTNNYNAEYGQAGGLIINAVTKSGTNGVHGEGHMYFRGRNLTASNPFYNLGLPSNAVPAGTVGPLGSVHCPTSDFVSGTLVKIDGCDRAPFHRKEGGFTIGGPFVKNHLFWFASYELSRQAASETLTPASGFVTLPFPVNDLLYAGKIDYKISEKHVLTGRYNVERTLTDNLVVQTSNAVTPDDLTSLGFHSAGVNVGLVSTLTPTLVNEARFAFLRSVIAGPADKTTLPGEIHTQGFISGANFCCPQGGLNKRYQYIDNLTWTHGKHTFKTGFNISYYPWFSIFQQFHFGQYTLNSVGNPTSFTFGSGPATVTSKDNIYGFYFQDTWKLSRKLTMNAGLRYDVEAGAFKGGTVKGPNGTCFQGNGIIPACSSDKNNWQPRLGFTYAPWEKTLFKLSFAESTVLAFNNVVLDSLNFDGINLRTGFTTNPAALAAFPNFPNPALLTGPACPPSCGNIRPISNHLKNPEIRSVNFGIQHEFTKTLAMEIQYIGQWGFGLFGERDLNAPVIAADPAHPGFFYFQNQPSGNATPDSRFGKVRTNENSRTSHYNGLLVSATKRFSNHVQFAASYTWSHALTSGEDFFGLSEPGDPRNIRAELGPAFNDIRHAANFGVVLDSGKLTNTNVLRWFTNDLGLSFVGQLQSGRPYPFSTGSAGYAAARFFGAGNETQQRPNVLANGIISTSGIASFDGSNALFGPNAPAACVAMGAPAALCAGIQNTFLAPGDASSSGAIDPLTSDIVDFQFLNGNMSRDAGRGAPYARLDASLKKTFKIPRAESVSLELRADAFNVFNHSNWQGFNGNNDTNQLSFKMNSTFFTCGSPATGACMRPDGTLVGSNGQVLHLADVQRGNLDKILASPTFGGIGNPTSADIPRTFQLSFHVRF